MRPGKTRRKRTAVYRNEMRNVLDCFSFGQVHLTEPLNGFVSFCFAFNGTGRDCQIAAMPPYEVKSTFAETKS